MPPQPRILVVDDEPAVLLTYRLLLEQKGYAVTIAGSAREAVAVLEAEGFDLLLCDLLLEEQRSGFDIIEAGRKRNPDLGSVLLTGYASVEATDRAQQLGISVLFKPVDVEQLFSLVATLLNDSGFQAEATGT